MMKMIFFHSTGFDRAVNIVLQSWHVYRQIKTRYILQVNSNICVVRFSDLCSFSQQLVLVLGAIFHAVFR